MRLNDYDDDNDINDDEIRFRKEAKVRSVRTTAMIVSVFLLTTLAIIYFAQEGAKTPFKRGNKPSVSSQMIESKAAAKSRSEVDELVGQSTLTADDLDFWDDYPVEKPEEKEKPAVPTDSAPLPQVKEDPATDGKHTLIKHKDGSEEWAEINPYLQKCPYEAAGFVYQTPFMRYYENNKKKSMNGVTLSKEDEYVDFIRLKDAGVDYVMLKLGQRGYTTGTISMDEAFLDNAKRAADAGLKVGVYFVSAAVNTDEAYEEANFVLKTLSENSVSVNFPVAVSTEKEGGGTSRLDAVEKIPRTNAAITFMRAIEVAGLCPVLYGTKETLIKKYSLGSMTGYEIWLDEDEDLPTYPYTFSMWEYDDAGTVDGIAGGARMSISFEDYSLR